MRKRIRAVVNGRVQGVGFRPTVYNHAIKSNLTGFVKNIPSGVIIEAEGEGESITDFLERLRKEPPKQAYIEALHTEEIRPLGDVVFEISPSTRSGDLLIGMPPDLATCDECRDELFDSKNRRYKYPFINCTNCGPRFTIVQELPYDREKTSMDSFKLCDQCYAEYTDPGDRRFDAQPNACAVCGPALTLIDDKGEPLPGNPIEETAGLLGNGRIIAIKGLGGYHLSCVATSNEAISLLRSRKNRPSKALAVMFSSIEEVKRHCEVNETEERELTSFARPVVILHRRDTSDLSKLISPDSEDIGAFLPYTPLHYLLLSQIDCLVMTSGNLAEEPIVKDEQELRRVLGNIADFALIHNRPIVRRCDDSVMKFIQNKPLLIRRSRGFVPEPIELPFEGPPVIACGAELKNTFCITRGNKAFLSQHIGDLTEYTSYHFYKESIDDLLRLLKVEPEIVAHDMHPDYLSTRHAQKLGIGNIVPIQHHHAHIAACMVEHKINEPVIGVAFDGAGYGPDGTVWGGEFFLADYSSCQRVAHIRQYRMPGGEEAIRNPIRMALSYIVTDFELKADSYYGSLFRAIPPDESGILQQMIKNGFRSPLTSSCGRLFDAVAALLGICDTISYEGQAAIRLQSLSKSGENATYPFDIAQGDGLKVISFSPMIRKIIADLKSGKEKAVISAMFHNTIAASVAEMCNQIRSSEGITKVVLSGGVFQNDMLLALTEENLKKAGFEVYSHQKVPPNDGGIALGQAAIAIAGQNANNAS